MQFSLTQGELSQNSLSALENTLLVMRTGSFYHSLCFYVISTYGTNYMLAAFLNTIPFIFTSGKYSH